MSEELERRDAVRRRWPRWAVLAVAGAAAVVLAWLAIGAVWGVPGPGWTRRYSLADLHEADRVTRNLVEEGARSTGDICDERLPEPVKSEATRWHISMARSQLVIEYVSRGEPLDAEELGRRLEEADVDPDIVDWSEAKRAGGSCPFVASG